MSSSVNPEPEKETWSEWGSRKYTENVTSWKPWLEDQYLYYFGGKHNNKASYVTKNQLDKSKVTGVEQVDTLQDGVNDIVAGQVGKGGLLQPVGDYASKEGINRAERGGQDDKGGYMPSQMSGMAESAKSGGAAVVDGVKGAGGYVGGVFGGSGKEKEEQKK